jgi:hypothetical protein
LWMWFLVKSGVLVESTNDKSIIIFLQITADCVLQSHACNQNSQPII